MESIPDKKPPILVVDDDVGLLLSIETILVSSGLPQPALVSDSRHVMELLRKYHFNLVLLDLRMPHLSGMEVLRLIKQEFPNIECVIVTAVDEVSSAVEAMKFGAYDYLVKPLQSEKLIIIINNALERYNLKLGLTLFREKQSFSNLKNPAAFKDIVAEDDAMALIFHQAEACADNDYNLIITGETGAGKEMLARTVHSLSYRSTGPFVPVNMGALSKTLFEDEFFGHAKGAFTGAVDERTGFFEAAQGGTLFLDEITELDMTLQGKLLRVIEERELYRLGSTRSIPVDVRFIAATNRDINKEIAEHRFRKDLFYRLCMFQITIPPLRERKKDILPLAHHFLKIHAGKNQKEIHSLDPGLTDCLLTYPYPGNVRELENIITTTVVHEKGKTLTLSSAPDQLSFGDHFQSRTDESLTLAELEKQHIRRVLKMTDGNRSRSAKILGIGISTLRRKLKALRYP